MVDVLADIGGWGAGVGGVLVVWTMSLLLLGTNRWFALGR